jgi:predicted aldo/keto reductase-like oxidoreductase
MASLPTRKLGKFGPEITAMGLGLMGLSTFYGAIEADGERFKLLDRSYELGCRFWDSSDMYGDSEDLIGKWFKRTGKRDQVCWALHNTSGSVRDCICHLTFTLKDLSGYQVRIYTKHGHQK